MIRPKLLIATALLAPVIIAACSDVTSPKKAVRAGSPPAAILAAHSVGSQSVTLVATINGGGTADMDDGQGTTHWGGGIKLLSDGSATGEFDCVDQHGDAHPGNIWGEATSWSIGPDGLITVNFSGRVVPIPGGHPRDIPFQVTFQRFGGAGVGHWTLAIPNGFGGWFTVCFETLTSGQVVIRWE